jgi:hypothetical protein
MNETPTELDRFVRLPGLLRRWEIERVLGTGANYHIEEAGMARDGTPLYAVYRCELEPVEVPGPADSNETAPQATPGGVGA